MSVRSGGKGRGGILLYMVLSDGEESCVDDIVVVVVVVVASVELRSGS